MAEFAFDAVLSTVIRVKADSLGAAVQYLREQLDCYSPEAGGIRLPTGGVESAALTEVSLGNHRTPGGAPVATLSLFEVDGVVIDDPADLDGMTEPHLCDSYGEGVGGCHGVYDEARGDGYLGDCPACADAREPQG